MTTLPLPSARRNPRLRALSVVLAHPATWLTVIISTSVTVHLAAAWRHTSPRAFPDEYIYSALSRSLAAGDGLTIRGTAARFPALLEPFLAAPLWLVSDTTAAYRLTQALHVVAMSFAALPVYWLARRVGASTRQALACGAFTVALPSFVFSSYITADAIAFPLALGAVAAGVAALDAPTRRNQAAFVALAFLATFARVQYVVIPVAFVLAAVVVGRGRLGLVLRRHRVVAAMLAVPALLVAALGPHRLLGYYNGVLGFDVSPVTLAHWVGVDSMLLAFAAGVAIVPGAVAGLVTGLRTTAAATHRAFAALTSALLALVLLEAAFYAGSGSHRFQERYLIALVPLLPVAFCAGAKALPSGRWIALAVAVTLTGLSVRIPFSGYAALDGKQDSPFLMAVAQFEARLGIGTSGLVIALAIALLAGTAVAAALRPSIGTPLALGGAIVAVAAASLGATLFDVNAAKRMEATYAADGAWTWIDDASLGRASVLVTPGADKSAAEVHLFWNSDLRQVLQMPTAPEIDVFGGTSTTIARDGTLVAGGRPVRGPLLVEESYAQIVLDDARLVRRTVSASLWQPRGNSHVAMLAVGRYLDGWLDTKSEITVWPSEGGTRRSLVELRLSLPPGLPQAVLDVTAPGFSHRVAIEPGRSATVLVPVSVSTKPVRISLRGRTAILDGDRVIVARAERPRLLPMRPLRSAAVLPIQAA